MRIFGLTGGIGCGKSTVSKHWAGQGLPIIDADLLSRQSVSPLIGTLQQIQKAFGDSVVKDGKLDRSVLGKIVFSDLEKLATLESILQPHYNSFFKDQVEVLEEAGKELACYDNAILIEKFDWEKYRPIVVVHVPMKVQVERIQARNLDMSVTEIKKRIHAQMPGFRRLKYADYVIDNSGTVEETQKQADVVLKQIRERWL